MKTVLVNKGDLLEKIKGNRETHRKVFLEAVEGFRKDTVSELEDLILDVKKGKVRYVAMSRQAPQDHTKDYDSVISMLEMHIESEIEVTPEAYRQYVMDDWSWKREFVSTANFYNSSTAATAYHDDDGGE